MEAGFFEPVVRAASQATVVDAGVLRGPVRFGVVAFAVDNAAVATGVGAVAVTDVE